MVNLQLRKCCLVFTILISLLVNNSVWAHEDVYYQKDFGNIKTRIKTGFHYEEIQKVKLIGQLAEKLSKKLNYKSEIFLDFNHSYTDKIEPDYFISYDRGLIKEMNGSSQNEPLLKSNGLVIRQISKSFDPIVTLKLVEYAIKNAQSIKNSQKEIIFKKRYNHWRINTIDTTSINKIVKQPNSELLNGIVKTKVYRHPLANKKTGQSVSYFWQYGKLNVFILNSLPQETVILKLTNIYDFHNLPKTSAVIFDTDSSFYFVKPNRKNIVSRKQIIKNTYESYEPFEVKELKDNKIGIRFFYMNNNGNAQKTLIYDPEKDLLIQ